MKGFKELVQLNKSEFEVGIEREALLVAISQTGERFNLAISPSVLSILQQELICNPKLNALLKQGWTIVPEYSLCLIEIVSPPVCMSLSMQLIDELGDILICIEELLRQKIVDYYPNLSDYTFTVETNGSSPVNSYLLGTGEVVTDITHPSILLLEDDPEFATQLQGYELKLKDYMEAGIGIYNRVTSTHVTFHPEYRNDRSFNYYKYLRFLSYLDKQISGVKPFDQGNKRVARNREILTLDNNLRDVFLDSMLAYQYANQVPERYNPSFDQNNEDENLNTLMRQIADFYGINTYQLSNPDDIFRRWSSANYRPRVTQNGTPLIEIRAFGSNLGLEILKHFVTELYKFDISLEDSL